MLSRESQEPLLSKMQDSGETEDRGRIEKLEFQKKPESKRKTPSCPGDHVTRL